MHAQRNKFAWSASLCVCSHNGVLKPKTIPKNKNKNNTNNCITLFCSATVALNFCCIHTKDWTSLVIIVTWYRAFTVRHRTLTLWSHCRIAMFDNRHMRHWISGHSIRTPHWNRSVPVLAQTIWQRRPSTTQPNTMHLLATQVTRRKHVQQTCPMINH